MSKAVIVGAGCVGSTIAYTLGIKQVVDEIILIDINSNLVKGEIMDISHGLEDMGYIDIKAGNYKDCEDADIIIVSAGLSRKEGQSREDLYDSNKEIFDKIFDEIKKYYNGGFTIIVSNPVDKLTSYVASKNIIPINKLCGTGCLLDTSRWIFALSQYFKVNINEIEAYSIGKHGDNQDLVWENLKIKGKSIGQYCSENNIEFNEIIKQKLSYSIKNMGADIIKNKGRSQYGIAIAITYLVNKLKNKDFTFISLGNLLSGKECNSSIIKVGNFKIEKID